ncbi:hypothetical protein HPB52_010998 [Rhipicephalus sanguineus]|uniref:Uncharacterized protein n=1 Tax=Rhipicephalus sanguineus TaxID=34632 RepID=A0A9D4PM06_RHISA|nr:hypothetical protein HPB52_010998 [Rhipicephalus sanguineus]
MAALFANLPPFLDVPGTPPIPWHKWKKIFQVHLKAAGGSGWEDERRASALISVLGIQGQRKYFAAQEQLEAQGGPNATHTASTPTAADSGTRVMRMGLQHRLPAAAISPVLEEMGTGLRSRLPTAATRRDFLQGLGHAATADALTVADSARAQAYLCITSLTVSGTTFTVHLYAPPPEDALRGILSYAFDDFKDEAILEDLQASNPTLSIVGGRRTGKTPHILVALNEPKVLWWIL